MFVDPESGIDYYTWGVGSDGSQDDVIQFSTTSSDCGMSSEAVPYNLLEGHSYFITVKVCTNLLTDNVSVNTRA